VPSANLARLVAVLFGAGTRLAEDEHAGGQPFGETFEQPRAGQADVCVTVAHRGGGYGSRKP
jgi:hypothetical protein